MENLSDAVRKIKVLLFGERQRGVPENRVFLDKKTLLSLFHDWSQHDHNLRVLYQENQRLRAEGSNLQVKIDELAAQVEALRYAGNQVYAELQQWALCESHEETSRVFKLWLKARSNAPQQCLAEIRADVVESAIKYCNLYLAFPVTKGDVAEEVLAISEIKMYAAKVRQGGDV